MVGWRKQAARATAPALAFFWAGTAFAQVPPPPPTPPIPAGSTTHSNIEAPVAAPSAPPPSKLTVEGGIERAPCALADARFADVKVTLSDVVFNDLKVVNPNDLKPAFADLIGKTIPIAQVCEIRDAAATILRREGYLAAVQVPPQSIEGGVVHLQVLMAKLVSVQVRGDAGRSEALIAAYLNKLTGEEVFNEQEAERYLLLAKDLPGYDVRLSLRPANDGVPGDVIGQVSVVHIPGSVDLNVQDLGSHAVGRWGALLRGQLYGLLGAGDEFSLGAYSTLEFKEQQVLQTSYDFHLGSEGLKLGGRFTYAWTHPDLGDTSGNVRSHTLIANLEASYPLVRKQEGDAVAAFGIDFVNQDTRFNGQPISHDKLRVLYANVTFDAIDPESIRGVGGYSAAEPKWKIAGQFEIRHGLGILDATDSCRSDPAHCTTPFTPPSVPDANQRPTLLRLTAEGDWRPVPDITFALAPQAQLSHATLLNFERFSGGNYTVGRGYDPGSIIGDSGVGLTAEFRYGTLLPKSRDAIAWQPYAFLDAVWVWNNDRVQMIDNPQRLVSAGGGVRATWGDHARIDASVAVPLERIEPLGRKGDTRFLLTVTTRLLPWS